MLYFHFQPFGDFVKHYTTPKSRDRYADSKIIMLDIDDGVIEAEVKGTSLYHVSIEFNESEVEDAMCSCSYNQAGFCKHIIHVLVKADEILQQQDFKAEAEESENGSLRLNKTANGFVVHHTKLLNLLEDTKFMSRYINVDGSEYYFPELIQDSEQMSGRISVKYTNTAKFEIREKNDNVELICSCSNPFHRLCVHLQTVLFAMKRHKDFRYAFDTESRHEILRKHAEKEGFGFVEDPDKLFRIETQFSRIYINQKINILKTSSSQLEDLKQKLLPQQPFISRKEEVLKQEFLVFYFPEYGNGPEFELVSAPLAKNGSLKSPVSPVDVLQNLRKSVKPDEIKFFSALTSIANPDEKTLEDQLFILEQILSNPLQVDIYYLSGENSGKIVPKNLEKTTIFSGHSEAEIFINQQNDFYVLTLQLKLDNSTFSSANLRLKGDYFFRMKDGFYFINKPSVLRLYNFFSENKHELFVHRSQFEEFRENFLNQLENTVTIHYSFVKPAPKKVLKQQSLDQLGEHRIYLSESENYILITPVLVYGEMEVPVLSRRTIYTENPAGGLYAIERNLAAEHRLIRSVSEMHPDFSEQAEQTFEYYYLHKQTFLDEGWFIDAFEYWRSLDYVILGFNQLKNNRYNANKMKVSTSVNSGIDWFDIHASVSFGKQEVRLKEIQKSVMNKNRFVELGDGTIGLLPEEWIQKFGEFFRSGELKDDVIRSHKSNFQLIDTLFEQEVLDTETRNQLEIYREKLANFHSIRSVAIPQGLHATLRDYQKEGLNWLNFLDEFGFGGCLADDMGLGKTIQVIAYLLSQREKGNLLPNLVVLPTSLLFNWQQELKKFAPELQFTVLYGNERQEELKKINDSAVILTTYGTLLSDVEQLRKITFNCIILDESQAIKNPQSKRYKAVRLLQGRQRLVLTGTPVENNTFDLYAQLSFALPGFLGSAKQFADNYSTPIDKFQDTQRAVELQKKIHPFVLRRTKKQVATELPEKTEMVIYCEMGEEQRRVYNAYRKEFQDYLNGMEEDQLQTSSLHVLQGLTKLRQICDSPALLSDDEYYGEQSAKIAALLEQISALKGEHKILVFSQFTTMLDLIRKELDQQQIGYAYLTGQTRNRQEQVELFQEDENVRVFLISLKAGGTGLNLTEAEYVFIIDPWWNPAVENQAIDRAYRIGQKNNVIAVRLITPDSIEEKILELQQRKKQLASDLIHTDTNILKNLSKKDLMEMI